MEVTIIKCGKVLWLDYAIRNDTEQTLYFETSIFDPLSLRTRRSVEEGLVPSTNRKDLVMVCYQGNDTVLLPASQPPITPGTTLVLVLLLVMPSPPEIPITAKSVLPLLLLSGILTVLGWTVRSILFR